MAGSIDREQVRTLQGHGAPLVEVLPAEAFDEEHIAGAISIPLGRLGREAPPRLDRDRPVIVYCNDYQ
ncbi:MAG TPA: rhodanese-like domain-containing protein [Candidatus Binatia bacterium]|nr:rhodanese-like domain-containing protein [Candidatus Binatia bacterium]